MRDVYYATDFQQPEVFFVLLFRGDSARADSRTISLFSKANTVKLMHQPSPQLILRQPVSLDQKKIVVDETGQEAIFTLNIIHFRRFMICC